MMVASKIVVTRKIGKNKKFLTQIDSSIELIKILGSQKFIFDWTLTTIYKK